MFKIENIYEQGYSDEEFEELEKKYLTELDKIDKLLHENHLLKSELNLISDDVSRQNDEETNPPSIEYEQVIQKIESLEKENLGLRSELNKKATRSRLIHHLNMNILEELSKT